MEIRVARVELRVARGLHAELRCAASVHGDVWFTGNIVNGVRTGERKKKRKESSLVPSTCRSTTTRAKVDTASRCDICQPLEIAFIKLLIY